MQKPPPFSTYSFISLHLLGVFSLLENVAEGSNKVFEPISDNITTSYSEISSLVFGNFSLA